KIDIISISTTVLFFFKLRRNWVAFVRFFLHIVDIPICIKKACVDYAYIGSVLFYTLHIPQCKGVVIANSKDNSVLVHRVEVGFTNGASGIFIGAVVIVPIF